MAALECYQGLFNEIILLSGTDTVNLDKSRSNPNQAKVCVGPQWDFSMLQAKPDFSK